jgi:hypothetical protein
MFFLGRPGNWLSIIDNRSMIAYKGIHHALRPATMIQG